MCTITATEFKENFGKYLKLGQEEEISVTHRGVPVITIVPANKKIISDLKALFGTLPKEARFDDDIERE